MRTIPYSIKQQTLKAKGGNQNYSVIGDVIVQLFEATG
jgi:hypothetical protein